ncbi:MAG: hypothetical protein NT066_00705, partial [Candidatus Omnitrophica bacterium]|nr:hypothetical protein [Candidatus Omnitrophota bacterium]
LRLVVDEYNGNNICSIDILDFPIGSIKPNYCILDKYIILSLSPVLTKKAVDIYKNKQGSLSSDFSFTSVEENILSDYSNIFFFDVARLVNDIQKNESFKNLKAGLYKNKKAEASTEYLDSVFDILNSITACSFTNRMIDSGIMESSAYIKIRGL